MEADPLASKAVQQELQIINKRGLHARASARFDKLAEQFDAQITVSKDGMKVCATSIMGLLLLVAAKGDKIIIQASGNMAEEAVHSLASLINNRFEEDI